MNKQTNDFIINLKNHSEALEDRFGDYYLNATAEYLSNMSETPIERYNKNILYNYIQSAFKDFMSTADSPQLAMYDFFDSFNRNVKKSSDPDLVLAHACCVAMDLSQVREKKDGVWVTVNGFHVPADPKDDENLNKKSTAQSSEKAENYSPIYSAARKTAEASWPTWKKEVFNNNVAISAHAKKI